MKVLTTIFAYYTMCFMKLKENVLLFVCAGFVFFLVYILLAGLPLEKEIQFIPKWTIDIQQKFSKFVHESETSPIPSMKVDSDLVPFKMGQFLGYFTKDGEMPFILSFSDRASISNSLWSVFPSNASNTTVYSSQTNSTFIIPESGFPHIENDSVFIFYPGGNSFGFYDTQGNKQWSSDHWSPIVSFASSKAGVVVGYADGDLRYFDNAGEQIFSMYPGGSTYEIILGAAISQNGSFIGAVCGLEKQRFVLIQNNGGNSKIVYHEYLSSQRTEQTLVQFNGDGSRAFFNYDGGLGIVNCKDFSLTKIPMEGSVCSISELISSNILFVLCQNDLQWTVYAIESASNLVGSFSFQAQDAFVSVLDDSLFIGKDSQISKMEIVRK